LAQQDKLYVEEKRKQSGKEEKFKIEKAITSGYIIK
jgi:hypothetical protein